MSNDWRSVPAVFLGASLVMSGGCSYLGHESDPSITRSAGQPTKASIPTTYRTPEVNSSIGPKQRETLRLLGSNAAVNVIYISVDNAPTSGDSKGQDAFRTGLLQSDPKILAGFSDALAQATYGRDQPKAVHVTNAAPITLENGCIDKNNTAQVSKVEQTASSYSVKGELNVVALDADPCKSAGPILNGYGGPEVTPVINRQGFETSALPGHILAHEDGHNAGNGHADKAECKDPITITGCTVEEAADQNSVMSYEYSPGSNVDNATHYTAPELEKMGLLGTSEVVVNPEPGTINLVPMDQEGIKLIVIQAPGKSPSEYISFENDPYAAYTIACSEADKSDQNNKKQALYLTTTGDGKSYICYKTEETGTQASVQVRFPVAPSASEAVGTTPLAMVDTRKDSTDPNDLRKDAFVTNGYTTPNTVVFSDGTYNYIFDSFTNGRAVIKIVAK